MAFFLGMSLPFATYRAVAMLALSPLRTWVPFLNCDAKTFGVDGSLAVHLDYRGAGQGRCMGVLESSWEPTL